MRTRQIACHVGSLRSLAQGCRKSISACTTALPTAATTTRGCGHPLLPSRPTHNTYCRATVQLPLFAASLSCSQRFLSTGSSSSSSSSTSSSPGNNTSGPQPPASGGKVDGGVTELKRNDVKESMGTPEWVATRKANGEKRMSVSIRSGAQRQLARRPPNAPPYPPSSHSPAPGVPLMGKGTASTLRPGTDGMEAETKASGLTHHAAAARPSEAVSSHVSPLRAAHHGDSSTGATAAGEHRSIRSGGGGGDGGVVSSSSSPEPSPSSSSSSHPLLYSVSRFTEPVKRIILIRNGRSEANEDMATYVHTPDWRIPLVEEGKRESIAAGHALSELTGDDPVYFYYSPYIRSRQSLRYVLQGYDEARLSGRQHTREWWEEEEGSFGSGGGSCLELGDTLTAEEAPVVTRIPGDGSASEGGGGDGVVAANLPADPAAGTSLRKDASLVLNSGTSDNIIGVREDVRLRDGDIGRYTTLEELIHHLMERERYGKFFYRFPYGESGADVCDRVTSFLDAFQRERVEFPMNTNVVIITHGLTMRMFIKRWFHLTVETFHAMKSPPPGSLCTLTRLHHRSCFRLDESCVESMHLPLSLNEYNGYKYRNKRLLGSMSSGAPYM